MSEWQLRYVTLKGRSRWSSLISKFQGEVVFRGTRNAFSRFAFHKFSPWKFKLTAKNWSSSSTILNAKSLVWETFLQLNYVCFEPVFKKEKLTFLTFPRKIFFSMEVEDEIEEKQEYVEETNNIQTNSTTTTATENKPHLNTRLKVKMSEKSVSPPRCAFNHTIFFFLGSYCNSPWCWKVNVSIRSWW